MKRKGSNNEAPLTSRSVHRRRGALEASVARGARRCGVDLGPRPSRAAIIRRQPSEMSIIAIVIVNRGSISSRNSGGA